jgi:hypothetical protein
MRKGGWNRREFLGAGAAILGGGLLRGFFPATAPFVQDASSRDLSFILNRAAEYCDRLSHAVLNFVCRERIEEWYYLATGPIERWAGRNILDRRRAAHSYLYDYQLILPRTGGVRETRTLLREDGKDVLVREAPLKTHVFDYAFIVMGPLGLLSRANQPAYEFKIAGEEKIGGEPALIVEAVPKPGLIVDHLFGRIWLRVRDAGILKIQWNPASIKNYAKVEEIGRNFKMEPALQLTSAYSLEHNGLRFPGRYEVKEIYRRKGGAVFQRSEIGVVFEDYKFFTVETDVIYKGADRLSAPSRGGSWGPRRPAWLFWEPASAPPARRKTGPSARTPPRP